MKGKFKIAYPIYFIALVLTTALGCSKSTLPQPVVPPVVVYQDPPQYGTPFSAVPASKDMVMYEVNIRTYAPANFIGAMARLDSIKALGVNVIWLMPSYPIGIVKGIGSPYAIKDYTAVKPEFGTLEDFRAYVAKAHSLGMAVIMDWVANHTSWDHVWIGNKSWYKQDTYGNIIIPPGTNYSDVAALDFNNTDMRLEMIKTMKYWVYTANIDGYRCDFADNVPSDFWKQSLDSLKKINTHKLILLAEGTKGDHISAGFQLSYAFNFYGTLKGLFAGTQTTAALFSSNTNENASLPSPGIKLRYITNHDVSSYDGSTLQIYKSKQGALAAFTLASYMGGIPLIYNSQEVGYANTIDFFKDVQVNYNANQDMVAAYKKILAFKKAHEALKVGALTAYADDNVVAFERKDGTDNVLILVNIKNSTIPFNIPAGLQNTTWKNGLNNSNVTLATQYSFQPYEYLVLSK
jgi:glycosidase